MSNISLNLYHKSKEFDYYAASNPTVGAVRLFEHLILPKITRSPLSLTRGGPTDVYDFHYLTLATARFALEQIFSNKPINQKVKIITGLGRHNRSGELQKMRNHVISWAEKHASFISIFEKGSTMVKLQKITRLETKSPTEDKSSERDIVS